MVDRKKRDDWMGEVEKTCDCAPFQQLGMGAAAGGLSGYVSGKIGVVQSVILGSALFVLHVTYQEGGFTRNNFEREFKETKNKVKKQLEKIGKEIEAETGWKMTDSFCEKAQKFVKKNIIFVGAFTGCFVLGRMASK